MRVAVVHDWLYTVGGAERVLQSIVRCYPQADLFCLFDVLDDDGRRALGLGRSTVSFLQRLPGIRRNHRVFLPLMPIAIEQLDLRPYDLVISSSCAVAKGILTGPDQLHVSYVHSPMRYAWDLQNQYLEESGLARGPKSWLARIMLHRMRLWDARTAAGVDHYVANSRFVARRIRKLYGAEATVINPPVRVPAAPPQVAKEAFFLTASRMVPYKNMRMIVEAFAALPDQRLVVVGDGPEMGRIKAAAGANVALRGRLDDAELRDLMQRARAFIFAAEEDFGIVPVEAQAAGTPVIGLGRGGLRETVRAGGDAPTGLFFEDASPSAIADAVRRFLQAPERFSPGACHAQALRFSESRFEREFKTFVSTAYAAFEKDRNWQAAPSVAEPYFAAAE